MMEYKITLIPGDGIGPEIVREAKKVLESISKLYGFSFDFSEVLMGGASIDVHGLPLTDEAIGICKKSDAVLLGAVGGAETSSWYQLPPEKRPEAALLSIRKELGLFSNLRPAILFSELKEACPLKEEFENGLNFVIVRELTGGLYFGERKTFLEKGKRMAIDSLPYSEEEIKRVAISAFELAKKRRKKVCSVDKANVLATSRLWREVVAEVHKSYTDVELSNMLVDNCAMQLIKNPSQFDVILTENMFGDILSDEASMITGSLGMLPSASLGEGNFGLYEPSHGSAPDISGKNKANPIATILSAAMMLRISLGEVEAAEAVESAVKMVLAKGFRTADIFEEGKSLVGCEEMGSLIVAELK